MRPSPSTMATFSPLPPANALPSIEPTKSTVTFAVGRGAGDRAEFGVLLAQALDHRIDVALADLGGHSLDGQAPDRLQRDLRKNLEGCDISQILALGDRGGLDARLPAGDS